MSRMLWIGACLALVLVPPLAVLLGPAGAFAQDVVVTAVPAAPSIMDQILSAVLPSVLTVLGVLATVLATKITGWLGIKNEESKQRVELGTRYLIHEGLLTGLKMAFNKLNIEPKIDEPVPDKVYDAAVQYVRDKSPEATAASGMTDKDLRDIAAGKVVDVIGALAGAAGGPVAGRVAEAIATGVADAIAKGGAAPAQPFEMKGR